MAYNEFLSERIQTVLDKKNIDFEEKKMFGGLCILVDEKMCVGIINDDFMARIDPEIEQEALSKKGARPMDFTKKPMKGYLYVSPEGVDREDDLEYWIDLCLEFNPKAKSSKKKKK
jgi:TfoX/Sxy family transcriptional regulator of competence genes